MALSFGDSIKKNAASVKSVSAIDTSLFTVDDTLPYSDKYERYTEYSDPNYSVIDKNKDLVQDGIKATLTEFYDTARPEPQYSSEVTDIMGDTLQSVMFGGSSGADAAQLAQEQIEALN